MSELRWLKTWLSYNGLELIHDPFTKSRYIGFGPKSSRIDFDLWMRLNSFDTGVRQQAFVEMKKMRNLLVHT